MEKHYYYNHQTTTILDLESIFFLHIDRPGGYLYTASPMDRSNGDLLVYASPGGIRFQRTETRGHKLGFRYVATDLAPITLVTGKWLIDRLIQITPRTPRKRGNQAVKLLSIEDGKGLSNQEWLYFYKGIITQSYTGADPLTLSGRVELWDSKQKSWKASPRCLYPSWEAKRRAEPK